MCFILKIMVRCNVNAVYLQAASFGGVQDEELFQQVLAVRGHVERNPVFTTQHALSQFLEKDMESQQQTLKIYLQTCTQSFTLASLDSRHLDS